MASVPQLALAAELDRRNNPRGQLCLDVILRTAGGEDIIEAEITNLSATGFLADFPEGVEAPSLLDVELPHAGSRTAQIVWRGGSMAGCSFTRPLAKSEISAVHLKSEPRQMQPKPAEVAAHVDWADPIWDTSSEAEPSEKWSLRSRVLVICGVAVLPWLSIAGAAALLA